MKEKSIHALHLILDELNVTPNIAQKPRLVNNDRD
jgi:hypothetical protein